MSVYVMMPNSVDVNYAHINYSYTYFPARAALVGTWNPATTYLIGDGVEYPDGGRLKIARSLTNGNLNNNPTGGVAAGWSYICEVYTLYNAATSYNIGDLMVESNLKYVYKSKTNSNVGTYGGASQNANWEYVFPNPPFALFDNNLKTGFNVTDVSSTTSAPLTVSINIDNSSGLVNFVATMGVKAKTVTISVYNAFRVLQHTETKTPDTGNFSATSSSLAYANEADITFLIPDAIAYAVTTGYIDITFSNTGTGAQVSVKSIFTGLANDIGDLLHGANVGLVDYSQKTADAYGGYSITPGAFSKRANFKIAVDPTTLNGVYEVFERIKSNPTLFCGYQESDSYHPLLVFGFFREFSIDIAYPTQYYCTLEVEGLSQ